ncbi:hypothetical protein K9N50_02795 [bacterium]|nr:hypothetical protein [bacterium]
MRKLTNLLLIALLMSGLTFVGCSDDDDSNPTSYTEDDIVGTWKMTAMKLNGTDIDMTYVPEYLFTFNDDGTGTQSIMGIEGPITWTLEDDNKVIVLDTIEFIVSGNKMTWTEVVDEDTTIRTFTKQ